MKWSAAEALGWILNQRPVKYGHWPSEMWSDPALSRAEMGLAEAISDERVTAYGKLIEHRSRIRDGEMVVVPSDRFRIQGMPFIVDAHGDMATRPVAAIAKYRGPLWAEIEFDAEEIQAAFPAPAPIGAREWIHEAAEQRARQGQLAKRDALIKDCMKATGATSRQCAAAYKALPAHLRRARGKPSKSSA